MNIKIGLPRSLYYYYYGSMWKSFFKNLNIDVITSPKTNKEILDLGLKHSNSEMCLSLKNFIGHAFYLKDKCDYLLVPRIDNYGRDNQTCTNFLASYDILSNLIDKPLLNYNINYLNGEDEFRAYLYTGLRLGKEKKEIIKAYNLAKEESTLKKNNLIKTNIESLYNKNIKILIIGHPYNIEDEFIGKPIIKELKKNKVELIYSYLFHDDITNILSYKIAKELYFKYSKENIGTIPLVEDIIDGIVFISSFPCGLDSIVNELTFRKLKKPYLNIIVDDSNTLSGIETRIESFIDILESRHENG